MTTTRRLAAIMVADVVGYSRLMETDEAGTLAALKERRTAILDPVVREHGGRLVKVMGDGVLIEFPSAVNAVTGAIELQRRMEEANAAVPEAHRIVLRIGINLGDVVIEGSDIYGDGVNVAARLESLAEPGDVCVSASVYEQVKRKLESGFDELGSRTMKNISEPVQVYRVRKKLEPVRESLPLPAKPSIAVLPFTNMSSDSEQEHFADGLTEDLITDLSRNAGLFVIARHSTFAYKGKSVDIRQIARDLGVRYILEGSARRAAGRVRINVQLIDAIGGNHMWAERFDRSLDDIFAVQDEVTARIVEALVGQLTAPAARYRPANMQAYDLCVRGRLLIMRQPGSLEAVREVDLLLQQAIALDPGYAEAHRWFAFNLWATWAHATDLDSPNRRLSVLSAEKAVALDPNDAGNHWVLGYILAIERRWAESDAAFNTALELDPNQADAWAIRADITALGGQPEKAIEQVQKALRLNPHPAAWYYWVLGIAQYAAHQYEAAVRTLSIDATYRTGSRRVLVASLAQLGRMDEARREAALFMAGNPEFKTSRWGGAQPCRDETMLEHFVEGFRKAGLPE